MKLQHIIPVLSLCLAMLIGACSPSNQPTPALRGGIVPTRATETATPTPTNTPTNTPTATFTASPTPTNTPTSTPTNTSTATNTPTATFTASPTPTNTSTSTPTNTPTPSDTPTATATNTPTATFTASPTATTTPSNTPTPVSANLPTTPIPIAYGDVVTGVINNQVFEVRYTFSAQADDIISIYMRKTATQDNLDGYLTLLAPNGAQLVVNDDLNSLQGYDPGIVNYQIPQTGTYTIIASRFNGAVGTTQGTFELQLVNEASNATPVPTPVTTTETTLVYGQRAVGQIDRDNPFVRFQFTAQQGDVIGIQMNALSGNLDPLVVLLSPNGTEVASNDDDPQGGFNAYLRDFVIPTTGTYTILASRFNREAGTSEGEFEVILERVGSGATTTIPPATDGDDILALGTQVSGQIDNATFVHIYRFEGLQGQIVTFTMRTVSGDLDPYLILIDPNGQPIFRNDDGANLGFNASLDKVRLPMTGTYLVVATRFQSASGETTGTFQLSAQTDVDTASQRLIAVQPMTYDTPIVNTVVRGAEFEYYHFFGEAGDVINIFMTNVSGDLDPILFLQDVMGVELSRNIDDLFDPVRNFDNAAIRNYTLPFTGYYVVVAGFRSNTTGQYRLLVERTDTTTTIPQYALLDWTRTSIIIDNAQPDIWIGAGDWVFEGNEGVFTSLIVFRLPSSDLSVTSARLMLEPCYLTNNTLFTLFGDLQVTLAGTYSFSEPLSNIRVNPNPFITLSACDNVDITAQIRTAYAQGKNYVQFQVNFNLPSLNANGRIDAVIFVEPRLEIYFDE